MRIPAQVLWRIDLDDWDDLSRSTRDSCSAIVVEYGGTLDAGHGRFRRYRPAELCVRSLRELGVRSDVRLADPA